MHGHDCARLAGNDRIFHAPRIEGISAGVDIDERDATTTIEYRAGTSYERQVRYDDFATVFKAVVCKRRSYSHAKGIRSVRQQQSILSTAELRPLLREFVC